MRASWIVRCAVVASFGLLLVSCGVAGPNHSAERKSYLDALFENEYERAFDDLCPGSSGVSRIWSAGRERLGRVEPCR